MKKKKEKLSNTCCAPGKIQFTLEKFCEFLFPVLTVLLELRLEVKNPNSDQNINGRILVSPLFKWKTVFSGTYIFDVVYTAYGDESKMHSPFLWIFGIGSMLSTLVLMQKVCVLKYSCWDNYSHFVLADIWHTTCHTTIIMRNNYLLLSNSCLGKISYAFVSNGNCS